MQTALITGIAGQDGSYLAEELLARGWNVHGLVKSETAPISQHEAIEIHEADITDQARLTELVGSLAPDVVFNLAGSSSVAKSWENPTAALTVNSIGAAVLLESAWNLKCERNKDVRFVQAASAEIFGCAKDVPQNELTRISPVSPYGASKALAHHLTGVYRARGLFASSAILYNHESIRRPASFVTRKITSEVARIALGQSDRLQLGNMDACRDWGWAPDYVDALIRMASHSTPDDFVIATGVSHTVRDFVAQAFKSAGIDDWEKYVQVDNRFIRPTDALEMRGDSQKARHVLGWEPTVDFEGVVTRMVHHDLQIQRQQYISDQIDARGGTE